MGHHSQQPFDGNLDEDFQRKLSLELGKSKDLIAKLNELKEQYNLGETGLFPDGKLTEKDEGEIKIAIGEMGGRVIMNFGKPITWIGFTKEQAKGIAESLLKFSV